MQDVLRGELEGPCINKNVNDMAVMIMPIVCAFSQGVWPQEANSKCMQTSTFTELHTKQKFKFILRKKLPEKKKLGLYS